MDTRVLSAALQQDMMTIPRPSLRESSCYDCTAMPLAAKLATRHDIFEESVAATAAQKIRRGNKHAGCRDLGAHIRDKDCNPFARQHFGPDAFDTAAWFGDRAHFRLSKEIEQPR